jgi:hypothetical protein
MRTGLGRGLTLALLSALTAEFLLGDQYLSGLAGVGQQVAMIILFTAFYGGSAVVIRELVRRRGLGWPSIVMLALGFGLVEEGLLTESLFNPDYLGQHLLTYGNVSWLGTAPPWAVFVLTLHVVWSMAAPIAVAEALFAQPDPAPWLGRIGLSVAGGFALLGALATFAVSYAAGGFLARPELLVAVAVLAVAAIVVALRLPVRAGRPPRRVLPALVIGAVLSSAFQLGRYLLPAHLPAYAVTLILVGLLVVAVLVAVRGGLDVLGLALGALVTYGWVGLGNAVRTGPAAVVEQVVLVILFAAVSLIAVRRRARPAAVQAPDRDAALAR